MTTAVLDTVELEPREQIEARQLERLLAQLERVYSTSAYYRSRWDELGFIPGDVASVGDLARLPLTTKADLEAAIDREPPYGDLLAVAPQNVARVHFSSGTRARPTPIAWTAADLTRWAELYARMAWSQGIRPGDVYQCLFSYAWFVGGLGATAGYTLLGATVIPAGSADTERQIETIFRFGTTAVGATPSFLVHLADAADRLGRPMRDSQVRYVMAGGEPGGAVDGTRALIEEQWGARCYDGYGCLEFQPIAWECEARAGGHLAEDFALAEVLDPETSEPVVDGTPGVLVLTHLDKEACPLVRWWTGDIVVLDRTPCECGRTHTRLRGGVRGRADDMLLIRGVNLFPSAVEDVVRRQPGAGAEYRIVLDRDLVDEATGFRTGFRLQVESTPESPDDLAVRLADVVHRELKVRPVVEIVGAGSLARSTHKSERIVRGD
jgi:phenylacetate-CoA ligase